MKRHIVFSFIFVFWSLAVCTVLSAKIEEQMTAEVVKVEAKEYSLPRDVLFEDENGIYLYEVFGSEGLEKGKRVKEIEEGNFWMNEDGIGVIDELAMYIRYTSKEISPGDLVEVTPLYKGKSAEYLISDSGKAYIISIEEALNPFMQEAIKIELGLSEDSTVYNMSDVRALLKNLPILGAILAILLASIALWIFSWRKAKEMKKNSPILILYTGICGALFWGFHKLVQKIELPDSLLPKRNIFVFGYYKNEFSEVFHLLKEANEVMYDELIGVYTKNIIWLALIPILTVGLIIASRSHAERQDIFLK